MSAARIIPAHAGQTRRREKPSCTMPDHPRTCGANAVARACAVLPVGSSPHMRGKLPQRRFFAGRLRIIPAHAGQTFCVATCIIKISDHPRTCGANTPPSRSMPCAFGSSPHMRGKPPACFRQVWLLRIIPAHAGQTRVPYATGPLRGDHPRTCGANAVSCCGYQGMGGSSPHMRGKHVLSYDDHSLLRIIPAHAGQTRRRAGVPRDRTDHPRTCGANDAAAVREFDSLGSSPHMRGKLFAALYLRCLRRIIPAHAGQTCRRR